MSAETNQNRARAFFDRLGGEEPADLLLADLARQLDDAEARGRATDSGSEVAHVKSTTGEPSRAGGAGASAPMPPALPAGGFLSADPCALGLIRDTVREQLRQGVARRDLAFVNSHHDLEEMAANVTTAVAAALDVYLDDEPTDPVRPAMGVTP